MRRLHGVGVSRMRVSTVDHVTLVPDIGRALLVRLSLLIGQFHLVHRTIELVQTILLHIIVKDSLIAAVRTNIQSNFHLWVAAITHSLLAFLNLVDVVGEKGGLIEAASLVHALLSRGVELHHHG